MQTNKWSAKDLLVFAKHVQQEDLSIMAAKNHDYTGGEGTDPFLNFERSAAITGGDPLEGIVVRMSDKLGRIMTYIRRGELAVAQESIEDACSDLRNYATLIQAIYRQRHGLPTHEDYSEPRLVDHDENPIPAKRWKDGRSYGP